jgi:hypothetical protein
MGVKLPCSRATLERWWGSVSGASQAQRPDRAATFCELAK